jgi:phage-related protein
LIDGIKSMVSKAVKAVTDAVSAVVDGAKDFLGIHSPSRVFMELGGYTGEGFAIGVTDTVGAIQSATSALANAAVSGASTESPIIAARQSIADSRASSSAGPTFVINAAYVDREALTRFATEVSRVQGRAIGGKR